MKELGSYLKSTRVENGVSLEEAAEDIELSISQLESIESGNVRAFKDVYKLRQYVKKYAKYLGLSPEKVSDEFNDFLFEHTSKISLDDILEAKKKYEEKEQQEKEGKIKSPYTIEYKRKINFIPFMIGGAIIALLIIIVFLIISSINKAPVRNTELQGKIGGEFYEFT